MMMFSDNSSGRNFTKDPAVVNFKGRYLLYYTLPPTEKNDIGYGIGVAESTDLINFNKIAVVRNEGDCEKNGICAPGAIVIDGKVHLFYQTYGNKEKDAICHAYSEDGINFTRNETNPIVEAYGDWNCGRAIDADVIIFNNELYLYFASRDPEFVNQIIGVAKCKLDGKFLREDWKQCCDDAILRPELDWEQECIEASAAIVKEGKVYMFYAGAYNNMPQQIGVAVSNDAINFTRMFDTPFLPNGKDGEWNSSESGHPYVFEDNDGRVYLFFQGNNDHGKTWYISKVEIAFENGIPKII